MHLWSVLATRERSASTYPCRPKAEAFANAVDVVEHDVIQITGDPSTERTAPPRSTHLRKQPRLLLLDPARAKERLMKIQQHDGVVVDAGVTAAGLRRVGNMP